MPEEKVRLLELGFSDLLVKPASFGDVAQLCLALGLDN
jgi:DNA-binding response OmpR family regulator